MRKEWFYALGLAVIPLVGFIVKRIKSSNTNKSRKSQLFIGIELGGTNFNVAVAEPVISNNGQIIDFDILKRKSGTTYQNP